MRFRRTALVLGSALAGLFVCEIAVRGLGLAPTFAVVPFGAVVTSADPELLWEPNAGHGSMNQAGFRGAELETPKARTRIVFAGDSIAYGIELDDDQTIPARLEERLRAGGLDAEVLNLGVAGYNTIQEARRLEILLPKLEADQVILLFCLNDFQALDRLPEGVARKAAMDGAGQALRIVHRTSTSSELERVLSRVSHLYRLVSGAFAPKRSKTIGSQERKAAFDDNSVVEKGFDRIAAVSQGLGLPVSVAVMPSMTRKPVYHRTEEHELVARLAEARGFRVLDLTEAVREELIGKGRELSLPGDRLHPNADGADVVAEAMARWLLGG